MREYSKRSRGTRIVKSESSTEDGDERSMCLEEDVVLYSNVVGSNGSSQCQQKSNRSQNGPCTQPQHKENHAYTIHCP
jgi:hypothetical protein